MERKIIGDEFHIMYIMTDSARKVHETKVKPTLDHILKIKNYKLKFDRLNNFNCSYSIRNPQSAKINIGFKLLTVPKCI